jgi:hypothetical protein
MEHLPGVEAGRVVRQLADLAGSWLVFNIGIEGVEQSERDQSHVHVVGRDWWLDLFDVVLPDFELVDGFADPTVWWFNVAESLFVFQRRGM